MSARIRKSSNIPLGLILRSPPKAGVSKDGLKRRCGPSFETALRASSG
jgi:hypothetical protein